MKLRLALGALILAAIAGAAPVRAADWIRNCDLVKNESVETLRPGEWACANPEMGDLTTAMIALNGCDNSDLPYGEDTGGGGDDNATLQLKYCVTRTDSANKTSTDVGFDPDGICDTGPLLSEAPAYGPESWALRLGRWKLIRSDGFPDLLYDLALIYCCLE